MDCGSRARVWRKGADPIPAPERCGLAKGGGRERPERSSGAIPGPWARSLLSKTILGCGAHHIRHPKRDQKKRGPSETRTSSDKSASGWGSKSRGVTGRPGTRSKISPALPSTAASIAQPVDPAPTQPGRMAEGREEDEEGGAAFSFGTPLV